MSAAARPYNPRPPTPHRASRLNAPVAERVVVLLADVGGYTRFLKMPRISLLHAQALIDLLIQAVVRAPDVALERGRTTGDCTLFYSRPDTLSARRAVIESVPRLLHAFVREQERIESERICDCSACEGLRDLRLKFVAHAGETVITAGRRPDLLGPSVILAHRLLKNSSPFPEYLLLTEPMTRALPSWKRASTIGLSEAVEGFGWIRVGVLGLDRDAVAFEASEAAQPATRLARTWSASRLVQGTLRHAARRDAGGYRNLSPAATG